MGRYHINHSHHYTGEKPKSEGETTDSASLKTKNYRYTSLYMGASPPLRGGDRAIAPIPRPPRLRLGGLWYFRSIPCAGESLRLSPWEFCDKPLCGLS
jgi:hypothetical protein